MSSEKIILIVGAGPRVGRGIASRFRAGGYKVALAARSLTTGLSAEGTLEIKIDLADPTSVPQIFETVKQFWGFPSVVVYNGMCAFTVILKNELGLTNGWRCQPTPDPPR